ncbi:MAG: redoxin domain-containing protein [Proteobacteria bacterium]|nr:redoxin domain-containing protein [Pseudomonadota bacterium]MBU1641272.1 redoxin domain-containing protein [Pseudomonadota bacterium]
MGKGDTLPTLEFTDFATDTKKLFDKRQQPLVLVFFGADIDTKEERAIEVLADIQNQRSFYRQRNIELAAVFVQPELVAKINEIVEQAHIDFPVYVDTASQSFEKLGVYVMPSILIVNADGIIHEGLGYTRNIDVLLPGEVQVMLHEKSREELNALLKPETVERTMAQRRARLDYNYAVNLVQRQEIDLALEKLEMALDKDPEFVPALGEKGCLLVKKKKFQEAATILDRTLAMVPNFARALDCKAELVNAEKKGGQVEAAPVKTNPSSWGYFSEDEDEEETSPQ